jgi:hypothetical protein
MRLICNVLLRFREKALSKDIERKIAETACRNNPAAGCKKFKKDFHERNKARKEIEDLVE